MGRRAISKISSGTSRCVIRRTRLIKEYREVHFKPYRIVYRVSDDAVRVLMIADGRRDMEALLQRRLLEA